MSRKPIYKLVDMKGRILIPKELRDQGRINYGDIVRLGLSEGKVTVNKVEIVEAGDQSPEAVEAFVRSAIQSMPERTQLKMLGELENIHRTGLSGAWVAGILERQSYCHKARSCSERYRGTAFCMYGGSIFV